MTMSCKLNRHRPSACRVWNDGHYFSFCESCGIDLVSRPGRPWRIVQPTERVVWKPRRPFDMAWLSDAVSQVCIDAVPVAAEWRALIDRSRKPASEPPFRRLRRQEEIPSEVSPAC